MSTVSTQTHRGWRNAVFTIFALGGIAVSTWGPRLPAIRADLDIGAGTIGIALAGVTVGSITGLALSSAILSWLGNRRALLFSLLIVSVGISLVGVGSSILHSVLAASIGFVLIGLGIGTVDVIINVEGAALETSAGKTLMPLMHAGWSVGAIVGAAIGAACAALSVSVATQFLGEAVLIAAVASVSVLFLPAADHRQDVDRGPVPERIRTWLRGWKQGRLLLIGLVMLGVEIGEGTANSWLTLAVSDEHGQSDAVAALFFVAFAVGETSARVFGGPLVDRAGRVRTVRFTAALGVVGLLLFMFGGSPWLVLIGTLLWSIGVSMGFPLGMSAAADSGPRPAAQVSVVASIGYLANLGGPPLIGALSEQFGLISALWLVVAFLLVSVAAAGALAPSIAVKRRTGGDQERGEAG